MTNKCIIYTYVRSTTQVHAGAVKMLPQKLSLRFHLLSVLQYFSDVAFKSCFKTVTIQASLLLRKYTMSLVH